MESELACIDGRLVATAQAVIPVTDRGLIRGDGAFEVVTLYAGRPHALDAHLERLERSAAGLRLAVDVAAIRADVAALLATHNGEDGMLRIMCTRGGRRILLIEPMPELPPTLALEPVTYAPTRVLDGIKSLSYAANMLATRLAGEEGADDALLVSPHGRVLECPTASFFLVHGGSIQTPPLSDHILDSITRRVVLSLAEVREEPIELAALAEGEEAFVVSSGHGLVAVHRVGEHSYPAPGPRTRELGTLLHERILAELP